MANTLFIKIPNVTGSATTEGFNNGEIDLSSWSWAQTNSNTDIANSEGGSAGVGQYHEFTCTKEMDTASAALQKYCLSGNHITGEIVLTACRGGADDAGKLAKYVEIKMTKSMITSWSVSGQGGEGGAYAKPVESFTIATAKFDQETFKQGDDGVEASSGKVGMDAKTGKLT